MRYEMISGESDAVAWFDDEGNSGVARPGDKEWDGIEEWLRSPCAALAAPSSLITLSQAELMVAEEFERVAAALRGGYAQSEVDSWRNQAQEARAFLANPESATTPLLDSLMLPLEDKRQLCLHIVDKYERYTQAVGELIMWRRVASAALGALFVSGSRASVAVRFPEVPYAPQ